MRSGFSPSDISILAPDRGGVRDLAHVNATKAPEGAAAGAGGGAILGGALGWLVGMGVIAVPGVGQLVAAGPIIAAISGLAVGGTLGGLTGALVGMGIPEYEAQQYAGKLREGNILLCIHADSTEEACAFAISSPPKKRSIFPPAAKLLCRSPASLRRGHRGSILT